jgi:hypothetical protein
MWRLIYDFLKWAPTAICGSALAIAAIWESAKNWIGAQVAWGWAQMSDPWIAATVLFSVAGYVGAIIWTGRKAARDFDGVSEWTVSVDLGCMASSHEGGAMTRYIRDMCRFVNHSISQARVIDITMTFPYLDKANRPVILSATRRLPIDDVRIGPVLPSRYDPFLTFPIRIEPNETVEGRIEFEVPEGVRSDDLDLRRAQATVKEVRAQKSRRIREGEFYDALKQKVRRGHFGAPHPVWGPRFRRLWNRLKGRPSFRMGTIGQMVEDSKRRMAEIEQMMAAGELAPWYEGRSQYTIREAGCIAAGVLPLNYENSLQAQSAANQLMYFATTGAMPIATEPEGQRAYRKSVARMGGANASLPPVTLDTFITPDAFEHYRDKALRVWLRAQDPARRDP